MMGRRAVSNGNSMKKNKYKIKSLPVAEVPPGRKHWLMEAS